MKKLINEEMIKEYLPYLQKDIGDILGYIPLGIMIGMAGMITVMIVIRLYSGKWQWKRMLPYSLFLAYIVIVIQIAYLSREPGSRTDVALGLGDTWGETLQARAYVIENVIMFMPFGLLFPLLGKAAMIGCIPVAVCSSVALEGMQYFTQRGYCQLDDVVTNSMGAVIGYGIVMSVYMGYRFVIWICGKKRAL